MTRSEISNWIESRLFLKREKDEFTEEDGTHFVQFENGDTYSYTCIFDSSIRISIIRINHKIENISIDQSIGCGNYKLVSETTF